MKVIRTGRYAARSLLLTCRRLHTEALRPSPVCPYSDSLPSSGAEARSTIAGTDRNERSLGS